MARMEGPVLHSILYALTIVGVMALAAAVSPGHWFLRTAAFLAPLLMLLRVPAIELLVALALQGAIVATGVYLARRRQWRRAIKRSNCVDPDAIAVPTEGFASKTAAQPHRPRFSMTTLLLAMVLCGATAAIAARTPALNRYAWQSIALIGVCGGLATLLGAWAATRQAWRILPAAIIAGVAALAVGAVPAWLDYFVLSFAGYGGSWPPDDPSSNPLINGDEWPVLEWLTLLPLATLFVSLLVGSYRAVEFLSPQRRSFRGRRLIRGLAAIVLGGVLFLVVVPSVEEMYVLLTPQPIPRTTLPDPNAFDTFVAAGQAIDKALVNSANFDVDTAPRVDVERAAGEAAAAVATARQAFDERYEVPVDYHSPDLAWFAHAGELRGLARAFSATGKLATLDGKYDEALAAYLDAIHLGFLTRRGGVLVDGMVGIAITGIGQRYIFQILDRLTAEQCCTAIESIAAWAAKTDSYESLEYRDYVWSQHAFGWHGRLHQFLAFETGDYVVGQYIDTFDQEAARTRLLIAHLALRAHLARGNPLPDDWSAIEAAGLPPLGLDPFDPRGGTLRYRREGDDAVLYSIGPNRVDDGGRPPDKDDTGWQDTNTGDLRLDAMFSD